MDTGFYITLAQVFPILLLALIWDSAYLQRLRKQERVSRKFDATGVYFWTKKRVRVYILFVAAVVVTSIALTCLVLAHFLPDSLALRIALSVGLALLLSTLFTRICSDVIKATETRVTPMPDPCGAGSDSAKPQAEV